MDSLFKVSTYSLVAFTSFVLVLLFWTHSYLLTGLLIICSLLMYFISKDQSDLVLMVIGGLFGLMCEFLGSYFGVWSYHNPDLFGVPIWMFFLWSISSVYLKHISRGIIHIFPKLK